MCMPSWLRTVGSAGRCVQSTTARCLSNRDSTTAAVFCGLRACRCSVSASTSFTFASAALAYGAMVATHRCQGLLTTRSGFQPQQPAHCLGLPQCRWRPAAARLRPWSRRSAASPWHGARSPAARYPVPSGHAPPPGTPAARCRRGWTAAGGLLRGAPHDAVHFLAVGAQGWPGRRRPPSSGPPSARPQRGSGWAEAECPGVRGARSPPPPRGRRIQARSRRRRACPWARTSRRSGAGGSGGLPAGPSLTRQGMAPAAVTAIGSPGWSVWSATSESLLFKAGPTAGRGARWRDREASSQDWTSSRCLPSSATWWRFHSPWLSRCQLDVSGSM